jgi:hypothetical protein
VDRELQKESRCDPTDLDDSQAGKRNLPVVFDNKKAKDCSVVFLDQELTVEKEKREEGREG